jgi:hypothetical protein
MDVHILNGDALAHEFHIAGEQVIMRECLMDGPVDGNSDDQFWKQRAEFLDKALYELEVLNRRDVRSEFEKLKSFKNISAINLWFDHDLFCQVNMWFVVNYLVRNNINAPYYRVMPSPLMTDLWSGFGNMGDAELNECYAHRLKLENSDINLCIDLWTAYRKSDLEMLEILSAKHSYCFPFLTDAIGAHLQRFPKNSGRPERRLKEILKAGKKKFSDIFAEFLKTEGVYGFGDTQVKTMLANLNERQITE